MRKFLLFCMLLVAYGAQAASEKLLVVTTTNSERVEFALSADTQITFDGQSMLISSPTGNQSFEIAQVAQYAFEQVDPTGIRQQQQGDLRVRYSGGDNVVLEGLNGSSAIRLFSADGRQLSQLVTVNGTTATISLGSLPKGVYIISANKNQTIKIYKR